MAIPMTGVTTTLVSQTIGVGSNDVGVLCSVAASGGIMTTHADETKRFSSAFKIRENQTACPAGLELGELIPGAVPKHNIWSTNSPSEFYREANLTMSVMHCRLRNSRVPDITPMRNAYVHKLDLYAGYNHSASAPHIDVASSFYGANKLRLQIKVSYGDYNWDNVIPSEVGSILGGRIKIYNKIDNSLLQTIDLNPGTEIAEDNAYDYDIVTDIGYGASWVELSFIPSKWKLNSATGTYDYLIGVDLSRVLPRTIIDNRVAFNSYAILVENSDVYLTNLTANITNIGGVYKVSGSFKYPTLDASGQPNVFYSLYDISLNIYNQYDLVNVYDSIPVTNHPLSMSDFDQIIKFIDLPASYNTQNQIVTLTIIPKWEN